MSRFFVTEIGSKLEIWIEGEEAHHIIHVYRGHIGMEISIFDSNGYEAKARITELQKRRLKIEILSKWQRQQEQKCLIALAQGIIKSKSWDLLLQKMMELGLSKLYPLITQYVSSSECAGKKERWEKIMLASAKQCERNSLIEIAEPMSFHDFLEYSHCYDLSILAHNDKNSISLKDILEKKCPKSIVFLVGPEGGFSHDEIQKAQDCHIPLFSLGNNILRSETASMATLSILNFYFHSSLKNGSR